MNLITKIKSQFKDTEISESSQSNNLEVVFRKTGASVIVIEDPVSKTYAASYPELIKDGRGGWKTEEGYSENMLIDGLFWVLKQVKKHGKVKPEICD